MVEVNETTPKKKRSRRSAGAKENAAKRVQTSKGDGKKQRHLNDELAPKRVKAIDEKGEELVDAFDQRKIWLDKAKAAREALIDLMIKHKVDDYLLEVDTRSFKLELTKETKVSAKKLKIMPEET